MCYGEILNRFVLVIYARRVCVCLYVSVSLSVCVCVYFVILLFFLFFFWVDAPLLEYPKSYNLAAVTMHYSNLNTANVLINSGKICSKRIIAAKCK